MYHFRHGNRSCLRYIRLLVSAAEYLKETKKEEIFFNKDKKDHYMNTMFNGFDMDRTMLRIFTAASDISDEQTETHRYPCYGGNGMRGYVEEYNQEGEYSLIGRQGALSGNVQFAKGQFKNTEHALLVIPIIEMNNIWLNQLIVNLDLKRYQTGAVQPGLSVKNLQEIQIIMVPLAEQNAFAKFFELVDKSKAAVQKALDKTRYVL